MGSETVEKKKIIVGVNTLTSIDTEVYGSHSNFWYYNGKIHPDWTFYKFHPRRLTIDRMRNLAAEIALDNECDYLMFIDDDIIIEKDVLDSLLQLDKDIVAALSFIRGYPFNPMIFKERKNSEGIQCLDFYEDYEKDAIDGAVECDAVGFSCALIRCELLKKLTKPYFVTGMYNTEDIYFCMKAKREVPEVSTFCDLKKPTLHLLDKQPVHVENVEALRKYYESIGYGKDKFDGDRALEYLEKCKEKVLAKA